MRALKLRLMPLKTQYPLLDEIFWKWASLCTRMSIKKIDKKELEPKEDHSKNQFNKTQLNQAKSDIKDLTRALKKLLEQKQNQLTKIRKRYKDICDSLKLQEERDTHPTKKSNFRPKKWVQIGLLKTKYHTYNHWLKESEHLERAINKTTATIEKIKNGKIRFRPTRVTLHQNSFSVNFAKKILALKLFHRANPVQIQILTRPIQPLAGKNGGKSSLKSKEYLEEGIQNYIAYSIYSLFFGMNDAEKMLIKAKNPEKIIKRDAKISKKFGLPKLKKSFSTLEKIIGRTLTDEEKDMLKIETKNFFSKLGSSEDLGLSQDCAKIIWKFASEAMMNDALLPLSKYPIIIRKPLQKFKAKKLKNLKPEDWKYYAQFSYDDVGIPQRLQANTFLGIDRGIKHLLAISVFDPQKSSFQLNQLIKNPVKKWKWRKRNLMRSIQYLERKTRSLHNVKLPEARMKKEVRSIENRVDNYYHNVSRRIVDLAIKNNSVIVFEHLSDMKQHGRKKNKSSKTLNYALSLFDYGKIASLILYKSKLAGVTVMDVLPAGTSQNCAKCLLNNLTKDEMNFQRDGKKATCKIHGFIDADLNAARTIAVSIFKGLNDPQSFGSRKVFKSSTH